MEKDMRDRREDNYEETYYDAVFSNNASVSDRSGNVICPGTI